jgi:hypothetical protein
MKVSDQLHYSAALFPEKILLYPFYVRLGEPQKRAGHCGEEKNPCPFGIRTSVVQPAISHFIDCDIVLKGL